MPSVLHKLRLVYFEVPKVASTAIKAGLFEAEFGRPFTPEEHHGRHVHRVMSSLPYSNRRLEGVRFDVLKGFDKVAVVRDPVKRLLSAYGNRVLHHNDVRRNVGRSRRARFGLWRRGLSYHPDLDAFLEKFEAYRAVSANVRHHTDHCRDFLGPDLGALDLVYPMERIGDFAAELSRRAGQEIVFPRAQEGGAKIAWDSVSRASQKRLLEITREEYDYLSDYYSPPEITAGAAA